MVCPLLKKGSCKKVKKVCKQKYSIKMINHKSCEIFGGKVEGEASKKAKGKGKENQGKKAKT